MLDAIPAVILRSRLVGSAAWIPVVIRMVAGAFVAGVGVGKFADRAHEVSEFRSFGVPVPEVAVPLAGTIEVVGGILIVLGFLTRPAALAVAMNLLGALLTAGRNEGGTFHLVVGPTLMLLMVVLAVVGAGPWSVDEHLLQRRLRRGRPSTRQ